MERLPNPPSSTRFSEKDTSGAPLPNMVLVTTICVRLNSLKDWFRLQSDLE